ncbi:unnamed protein product [Trichobilharzia regenti]|nr:unnamed protein product [Trichobilharzia regenti]
MVKRDPLTQQSKGYGFIRFADYTAQVMCLAERHSIDNRQCDVRIPISKTEGDRQEVSRKVHIGRLTEDISAETLRQHFSQYGRVSDVFIPKPFRSFAFVTFEDPEVASSLLGKDQDIEGVRVTVGSAVPKLPPNARLNTNNQRIPANPMQAAFQSTMMGTSQWSAWHPAYSGMMTNNRYGGQTPVKGGNRSSNGSNRNSSTPINGQQEYNGLPVDSTNNAALATMNILSNPNVVAAIVSAATGAGNTSMLGSSSVSAFTTSYKVIAKLPTCTLSIALYGYCVLSYSVNVLSIVMGPMNDLNHPKTNYVGV